MYSYAADGTKLRTVHTISGTTTQKDYCANVVYENGVQKLLLTEEGYVNLSDGKYYYYLKDHQGNNRVVVKEDGTIQETNHYYPFGGVFASTGNVQPYKYNGKELDTKKGLNWYDYGARHYDAMLGRWFVVDPLAEKYYSTSVYGYCLNNPIKYVDPKGKDVLPYDDEVLDMIVSTLADRDRDYVRLDENGFIDKILLNSHKSKSGNFNALKELVNSELLISVKLDDSYSFVDNEGNVYHEEMSYNGADEFYKDPNFESTNGLTTGEMGKFGITLLPGKGKSGVNSSDENSIDIIVNKNFSKVGRAESYSHEANGHALMFVRTKNRDRAAHDVGKFSIEQNVQLREMIIQARKETVKNLK